MKARIVITAAGLVFLNQLHAYAQPRISPEFIAEVQRVCMTIDIAEFPIRQGDLQKELDLPPYTYGMGFGGRGKPNYISCPISDRQGVDGYYELRIFFGEARPNPGDIEVKGIEVAYVPHFTNRYPPFGALIYVPNRSPDAIARDRRLMKEAHLTPGEYVRQKFARFNLPNSAQLTRQPGG